ncbi:hypothetical protein SEPCBS119000_005303 [Sporothrix epigloea]|uniref:BHLH domain-containing protein n=1 Tax=Sporothrix epigloea TaxID=1892477 RepID=A0ABP0DWU7_9PEZI
MTFAPGVYLYNKDAVYGHVDPRDTYGRVAWAQGATNDHNSAGATRTATAMEIADLQGQYLLTASPSDMFHPSLWPIDTNSRPIASSSSSSSTSSSSYYTLSSETATTTAPPFPSFSDRAWPTKFTALGPLKSPRVSKCRTKPVGRSARQPQQKRENGQRPRSPLSERAQLSSSASSATSPAAAETLHRHLPTSAGPRNSGGVPADSHSTTGHGGNHNITLRTASRRLKPAAPQVDISATPATAAGPKVEPSDLDPSNGRENPAANGSSSQAETLTLEERRVRQNHNIVEKQYRNRLNSQFERLLSILPANRGDGHDAGRPVDFDDRRMSKAEVLKLARRRINSLNDEIQKLNTESENLRTSVQTLNMAIQGVQQIHRHQPRQVLSSTF